MAWETFTSRDGIYAVDWGGVSKLIRSYVRSEATLCNAKVNTEHHWNGPNLHTVDVEWDKVQERTRFESETSLRDFYNLAQYNMQMQLARLVHWVDDTRVNNARFQKLMRDAQKETMANIDKSVERWDIAIKGARLTRDFSAEFVMVSATAISGGTALALGGLATGAGLKATARAQDDPHATKTNIAATFASEFAIGLLDLKVAGAVKAAGERAAEEALKRAIGGEAARKFEEEAAKKGVKAGLMILYNQAKLGLEPAKAIIQGKTFKEGLVTGGLKTAGGIHGEILKYLFIDDEKFEKLAALADTTISFGMDKLSEFLTEREKEREPHESKEPEFTQPVNEQQELLDALAYERRMIERMAVRQIGTAGPSKSMRWSQVQSARCVKY
jgi:hypothetical protein